MSTPHYCLQVKRLENLQWKRCFHRKIPSLYGEVKVGTDVKATRTIKKSGVPVWNEELTFSPSDDIDAFNIRVLHTSKWFRDVCVGGADITIAELLAASANGETCFDLYGRKATERSGTMVMHLKLIDTTAAAAVMIDKARRDIQGSGIARPEQLPSSIAERDDRITQSSSGSKLYQAFAQILPKLNALVKVIDAVSETQSYLAIACKLTSTLLKAVKHVFDTDKKLIRLVLIMKDAYDFSYDTLSLPGKAASLEKSISELVKQTIECCLFIGKYTKGSFVGRMLDTSSSDKIDEFEDSLTRYRNAIESGVNLQTAFVSVRILDGIDEILLRQRLEPSQTDASTRPRSICLKGTRAEILQKITEWIFSESEENIFWLHGVAGSGKSTISMTIAERFRNMLVLGGSLVFERGKSDPSSVIRTIAYKLALHDSRIASEIVTVMKEDKDIVAAIPATQFEKLLLRPLAAVADSLPGPVAFVLDALDECGAQESRHSLLELFRLEFAKLPKKFRFLITSRRENDIDYALASENEAVHAMELDYTSIASHDDVRLYLRKEMYESMKRQVGPAAAEDWNWDKSAVVLGKAAGGLFIFASTAVKMISISDNPFDTLEGLITDASSVTYFGLNELYATALRHSGIAWDNGKSRSRFANVLALVLLSKRPVTSEMIDGILGFSPRESSLLVLSRLRCLLSYSPGGPISLFHTSFYDYLTSPERAVDPWCIDISEKQHFTTARCFTIMQNMLHFNMCSLESSFVRNEGIPGLADQAERSIPAHLEYVCLYWSSHLCNSQHSSDLINMLLEFAHERLLFWFEALSLMTVFGRFASPALADAAMWVQSHNADLSSFLKDGSRLALVFGLPIIQSTPHIYTSMIPLTKDESIVSSHYSKRMSNLVQIECHGTRQTSACLKVLEGHSQAVCSVDVSPDGTSIASASWDGTIRVWDIANGEEILASRHDSPVWSISFSPDGSRLVSGFEDGIIGIWDISEGIIFLGQLKRHTDLVRSVAYSPNGTKIASGSEDSTVIVWDAISGVVVAGPFLGHSGAVRSVAFSADGSQIASGSEDRTLRIWEMAGELVSDPFVHPGALWSVAFCPTSRRIVSGCDDGIIRIWDTENGSLVSVFSRETTDAIYCVAYSPCGTRIVSGSSDGTVAVWDASGHHVVSILMGHSDFIDSVAFTPDGKYIVSGSDDKTIRIWDAVPRQVDPKETVHCTSVVMSVAFSPCGQWIASASGDMTIIIWNSRTGEAIMSPLRGHTSYVTSVTFSPDGSRLVSGSWDKTIRIWDVESGKPVAKPLEGHTEPVLCIALSPDGAQIVSGCFDNAIWVWDMAERKLVAGPLRSHSSSVSSVAFSSDSTHLASCSYDSTIRIWDTKTWKMSSEPLTGHESAVRCVCFSPDSTRIASSSHDATVIVWDAETGQIIAGPFKGHESQVSAVIFLPDGSHLASGSEDGGIKLWSISTGQAVGDPLDGHSGVVISLALSPDGTRIASGSSDKTVRIWDVSAALRPSQKSSSTASSVCASSDQDLSLSDWTMEKDGWVLGGPDRRHLLFWIPHDLRRTLWRPQNTTICADFSTKLDFTAAALGRRWTECFTA